MAKTSITRTTATGIKIHSVDGNSTLPLPPGQRAESRVDPATRVSKFLDRQGRDDDAATRKARDIALRTGQEVPLEVTGVLLRAKELGVDVVPSLNLEPTDPSKPIEKQQSCAQIIQRRQVEIPPPRRSHIPEQVSGLPLYVELKTGIYEVEVRSATGGSMTTLVYAHTRGHQIVDMERLAGAFRGEVISCERASDETLAKLGTEFGKVNPFNAPNSPDVVHIFDPELMRHARINDTVTTNAGDFAWGIEFSPSELAAALAEENSRSVQIHQISENDPNQTIARVHRALSHRVAVSSGNGPATGAYFQSLVTEEMERKLETLEVTRQVDPGNTPKGPVKFVPWGDLTNIHMHNHSNPETGLSMSLAHFGERVLHADLEMMAHEREKGATVFVVPCCTRMQFDAQYEAFGKEEGIGVVKLSQTIERQLTELRAEDREKGIHRKVFVLGGKAGFDPVTGFFSKIQHDYDLELPDIEQQELLQRIIFDIKGDHDSKQRGLRDLNKLLLDDLEDVDVFVLGASEFELVNVHRNKHLKKRETETVRPMKGLAEDLVEYVLDHEPATNKED